MTSDSLGGSRRRMVATRMILLCGWMVVVVQATQDKYDSNCETLPMEIHISKDEYDSESHMLMRTCEESIIVNKCEGACTSSIQPSAKNPLGFHKECKCCRESSYRERTIKLTNCYDPDGQRLTKPGVSTMSVSLNEPNDCQCHECGKKI
ncbi:hypothetical protein TCAL_08095 [Tigriopus californicus]|uniref:CTCK domain-containing protein n=1 Tax=Tigriopus californicus TaxID=6832 RepID=A0A553PQJ3_TIGCA|nr:partner of bursicon-like [Tigriopus californicus]TRY79958.1 hypothetical protein TCAL_08095 [Tigriopus californicus]|eukprot:TCALIF_08095-PA protein Name:"Similar to Pburs Partner of bursicon (Drosophila melanogaster)" AED:0.03 eAED:0.03 QI:100/1/1/1/0.66/0.75/4/199/149